MMLHAANNEAASAFVPMALISTIPASHPGKAEIEARFERLIETLGPGWFVVISPEGRRCWNVCLGERRQGQICRLWSATLAPSEQDVATLEIWLRGLARRLQTEMDLHIGLRPVGPLPLLRRKLLLELVTRHRGGCTRDGHIVVSRELRPAFLNDADRLGFRLEVALWDGQRPVREATMRKLGSA
jgi:hypothetical protein